MQSLFEYKSYRKYLKDCLSRERASSRKVTVATYARKLGMSAPSLTLILSGARNLTLEHLHQAARMLRFSPVEHDYFEALVLAEQSSEKHQKRYYERRLKLISSAARPMKSVRTSEKILFSDWIVPALLVYLVDFELTGGKCGPDALGAQRLEALARKFGIPADQFGVLVDRLRNAGLLSIDPDDRVHVVLDKLVSDQSQSAYIQSVLSALVRRAKMDFKNESSIYRAFVFTVDRHAIPELRTELIALMEKYMAQIAPDPPQNMVVQAFTGLFPVLEIPGAHTA